MKIRPVRAELFHADEQTDGHTEANSRFFPILQTRLKMNTLYIVPGSRGGFF